MSFLTDFIDAPDKAPAMKFWGSSAIDFYELYSTLAFTKGWLR